MKKALLICFILSSLCFFKSVKSSKRIKRELKFPKGASFTLVMALTNNFPEGPLTRGLVQVIDFDFGFPFPEQVIYDNSNAMKRIWVDSNNRNKLPDEFFFKNKNGGKYRGKRNSKEIQRQKLLYKVEDVVRRLGYNGLACISRFQCEINQISPDNSLLEEIIVALFKPNFYSVEVDCEKYINDCPFSLLHVILHSQQNSVINE